MIMKGRADTVVRPYPKHYFGNSDSFWLLFLLFPAQNAAAQEQPGAQHETEIVPAAAVVHVIDADPIVENGNDESDRRDQSVPHSLPEAGDFPFGVGCFFELIRSGRAG